MSQQPPDPGLPPRAPRAPAAAAGRAGRRRRRAVHAARAAAVGAAGAQHAHVRGAGGEQPREAGHRARAARRDPRPTRAACSCATASPTSSSSIPGAVRDSARRHQLLLRVAHMLDLEPRPLWERVDRQLRMDPVAPVTLAHRHRRAAQVVPAGEPGRSSTASRWRRCRCATTPTARSARTSTGSSREIGPEQLKDPRFHDYHRGDVIGQSGVERRYDAFLRGVDGVDAVTVDAFGQPTGAVRHVKAPVPGRNVRLTIDLDAQRAAEQALAKGVRGAAAEGADAGAIVALDPANGAVRALASYPDVRPELVRLVPQAEVQAPARAHLARRRRAGALPAARPRHRRPLSRGLDVQAVRRRSRRSRSGASRRTTLLPLHARRATTTTSGSTTGTRRSTGAST